MIHIPLIPVARDVLVMQSLLRPRLSFFQISLRHRTGFLRLPQYKARGFTHRTIINSPTMSSFHDLKAERPDGEIFAFEELKGKVVLVVNVASQCGFTPQYKGLQALYDKYKVGHSIILSQSC